MDNGLGEIAPLWVRGLAVAMIGYASSKFAFHVVQSVSEDNFWIKSFLSLPIFLALMLAPFAFNPARESFWSLFVAFLFSWLFVQRFGALVWGIRIPKSQQAQSFWWFTLTMYLPIRLEEKPTEMTKGNKSGSSMPWQLTITKAYASFFLFLCVVVLCHLPICKEHKATTAFLLYPWLLLFMARWAMDQMAVVFYLITGKNLAPAFNEPYLSESLTDFWGQRWNLVVSEMHRTTVYDPLVKFLTVDIGANVKIAKASGVMACFLISAFTHEYMMRIVTGVWSMEWFSFFIVHGMLVVFESLLWRRGYKDVPKAIRIAIGYIIIFVTANEYMWPPVLRMGVDEAVMVPFIEMFKLDTLIDYLANLLNVNF